jgi:hypothetical protein
LSKTSTACLKTASGKTAAYVGYVAAGNTVTAATALVTLLAPAKLAMQ